jgi:hypothetical protein
MVLHIGNTRVFLSASGVAAAVVLVAKPVPQRLRPAE